MMNETEYVKITLNGFLLNAGVVGLLKLLDYAADYDDQGCVEGEEYYKDGQSLFISKNFLLTHHLADLYIKSMVYYLKKDTQFLAVLEKQSKLDSLYSDYQPGDKEKEKAINAVFSEFTKMLQKSSFSAGYEILSQYNGIDPPTEKQIAEFKAIKEYPLKKQAYDKLCDQLRQPKVQEVLLMKELLYSKLNLFIASADFYLPKLLKSDITDCYHKSFVSPLREMLTNEKPGKKRCIDCGNPVKNAVALSFMNDTADDLNRKKSYYWNCNPDAYVCPLCAFVYSLAPLGFTYIGRGAVFINNNQDVETLYGFNQVLDMTQEDENGKNAWYRIFNALTGEKIRQLNYKINNIQVVFRNQNTQKYNFNIIDKQIIEILQSSAKQLNYLKNRTVKDGKDYINVYQSVIERIANRLRLYPLINRLLRIAISESRPSSYLFAILEIQINCEGGKNMTENRTTENWKRAFVAKKYGEQLRQELTVDLSEKDKDNKLRGFVYQLLNAVSLDNRDKFLELVLRTYSSCGKAVPDIFFNCFKSDEDFREVGYAYLLGLKSGIATEGKDEKNEQK